MAKASGIVALISLLAIFLGAIFWGIFAPLIIDTADDLNGTVNTTVSSEQKIQACGTCQTLINQVPLFTVLGYWLFIIGGVLGLGFAGFLAVKGK